MSQDRTTFEGRHYRLDDAPLSPRPVQQPRIPLLIAAHRPRMLRLAARYADQWDTFATLPGTATDGLEAPVAERIRALDAACARGRARPGRDPPLDLGRGGGLPSRRRDFEDFVRAHRALGFTDFSDVRPPAGRRACWSGSPARRSRRCAPSSTRTALIAGGAQPGRQPFVEPSVSPRTNCAGGR